MDAELDCQFMIDNKRVVSVIPARGGSKRIPKKNLYEFEGLKLIEWSIRASISNKYVDHTIVSTDDKDIIKEANKYNVQIHNRSKSLSCDRSSSFDLLKEIYFNIIKYNADIIILLQPTSPLRENELISNALEKSKNRLWSSIIEVYQIKYFTGEIKNNLWIADYPENTRSQDIPEKFVPSGRFYAYNVKNTIEKNDALGDRVVPIYTEESKNINIDEYKDLEKLKYIYKTNKKYYEYLIKI